MKIYDKRDLYQVKLEDDGDLVRVSWKEEDHWETSYVDPVSFYKSLFRHVVDEIEAIDYFESRILIKKVFEIL